MVGRGVLLKMSAVSSPRSRRNRLAYPSNAGFAVFFAIFELTRQTAQYSRKCIEHIIDSEPLSADERTIRTSAPRFAHGTVLVSGGVIAGVAYEFCGRPWDVARKVVHVNALSRKGSGRPSVKAAAHALLLKARSDGLSSYFQDTNSVSHSPSGKYERLRATLRLLARVGPWGAGFLLWEAFGPGLDGEHSNRPS